MIKYEIINNNDLKYINITSQEIKNKLENNKDSIDNITKQIVNIINENKIGFPFKRHFMKNPRFYYDNIFKLDITLESKPFRFKNIIPKMGFKLFEEIFNYKFRGKFLYMRDNYDIYQNVNIITDFFTEKPRIESTGHGEELSPMELWNKKKYDVIKNTINKNQSINSYNLRETIYDMIVEARMGKTSHYYTLYHFFKAKKILDPSCAWGDRLIAAIAYNCDYYLGIDPNKDLIKGHNEIIKEFAPLNKHKFEIIYKPFEDVDLTGKTFDFILSSPAPFEGDYYGNREGQSTDNYTDFNTWFMNYMFITCFNSYQVLENNGYFLITFLDRLYPKPYAIVELLLLTILYKCKHMFYVGVIGWEASRGKVVPFWVFQRCNHKDYQDKIKFSEMALQNYYSEIYCLLKKI